MITEKKARSAMKELGFTSDTIYNIFSRGRSNFLSRLVKAGILEDEGKGTYVVIDPKLKKEIEDTSVVITSPKGDDENDGFRRGE